MNPEEASAVSDLSIEGFVVRTDLAYDIERHMWVAERDDGNVRVGMDTLGVETAGTLAQLDFVETGTVLVRGEAFGTLEAEKFVGPLVTPISGVVVTVNTGATEDPGVVEREPYDGGWMVEISPSDPDTDIAELVSGVDSITDQFRTRIAEYRRDGVLAE